jgi:hypothetical protein
MPQQVADSIHGFAVIKYESEAYCPLGKILDGHYRTRKGIGFGYFFFGIF